MQTNKKGFTLIELLAVIIILGILMLIAIPSVTNYINNSRKESYVTTVQELVKAAGIKTNSGELDVNNPDMTYYIPCTCLNLENGEAQSPYGKFDPAYVVVSYNGDDYNYFFVGKDKADIGIPSLTRITDITKNSLVTNIENIDTSVGVTGTTNVTIFNDDCSAIAETKPVSKTVSGKVYAPGESQLQSDGSCPITASICKRADVSTLHTEECNYGYQTMYYNTGYINSACYNIGYTADGAKGTTTVTYGNKTTTNGVLKPGDAFDCDVNCDGIYDPEEERFYYVYDYFDTATRTYDTNYAVLMYSTNFVDGEPVVGGAGQYFTYQDALASNPEVANSGTSYPNFVGPVTGIKHLPKTTGDYAWRNDLLKTKIRRIYSSPSEYSTEQQTTACYGKELPTAFSYENNAARLITVYEVSTGCMNNSYYNTIHTNCEFLLEGTMFVEKNYSSLVWFENPTVHGSGNIYYASTYGNATGYTKNIGYTDGNNFGSIKPTIDIPKTRIEY